MSLKQRIVSAMSGIVIGVIAASVLPIFMNIIDRQGAWILEIGNLIICVVVGMILYSTQLRKNETPQEKEANIALLGSFIASMVIASMIWLSGIVPRQ